MLTYFSSFNAPSNSRTQVRSLLQNLTTYLGIGLSWFTGYGSLLGQDTALVAPVAPVTSDTPDTPPVTPADQPTLRERRAEVMQFVKSEIPELERPLAALREKRPDQFRLAIRSLEKSYERLEAIQKTGNEALYQRALSNWKFEARIKMAVAQLSIADNARTQKVLKRAISNQYDLRIEQLSSERERLQEQIAKMETSIDRLKENRDSEIDRRAQAMIRNAARARELREQKNRNPKSNDSDRQATPSPSATPATPSTRGKSDKPEKKSERPEKKTRSGIGADDNTPSQPIISSRP